MSTFTPAPSPTIDATREQIIADTVIALFSAGLFRPGSNFTEAVPKLFPGVTVEHLNDAARRRTEEAPGSVLPKSPPPVKYADEAPPPPGPVPKGRQRRRKELEAEFVPAQDWAGSRPVAIDRGTGRKLQKCTSCHRHLPVESFLPRSDRPGRRVSRCDSCRKEYQKVRWITKATLKQLDSIGVEITVAEDDQLVRVSCADCGEKFVPGDKVTGHAKLFHQKCDPDVTEGHRI